MVALDCGAGVDGRTRAASAWGWSGYSDPIMVLTAGGGGASEVRKSVDASADAASTTKYVSRAPACLPTADRPEGRHAAALGPSVRLGSCHSPGLWMKCSIFIVLVAGQGRQDGEGKGGGGCQGSHGCHISLDRTLSCRLLKARLHLQATCPVMSIHQTFYLTSVPVLFAAGEPVDVAGRSGLQGAGGAAGREPALGVLGVQAREHGR